MKSIEIKTNKRIIIGALMFAICLLFIASVSIYSTPTSQKPEKTVDDETVYVILNHTGGVERTIVVDWIRVFADGKVKVTDVKPEEEFQTLKDTPQPEIKNGNLVWNLNVEKYKDLYYRTYSQKELPVNFEVSYYLNGKKMDPDEIAGKNGKFKMVISVENKLEKTVSISYLSRNGDSYKEKSENIFVPLTVMVSLNLPSDNFTNVDPVDGNLSVMGSKFSCSWMKVPQPKEEIALEAEVTDFEMKPVNISVTPGLPSLQSSIEIENQFKQLYDGLTGLKELSSAHAQIVTEMEKNLSSQDYSKLSNVSSEFSQLSSGLSQVNDGIRGVKALTGGQIEYLNGIISGINPEETSSVAMLPESLEQLILGLKSTKDGVDGIKSALQAHVSTVESLRDSNSYLTSLAADRKSAYPGDTTIAAIYNQLDQQNYLIDILLNGGAIQPGTTLPGLTSITASLDEISTGLEVSINSLKQIHSQSNMLSEIPASFEELKNSLILLRDGGSVKGVYMPGIKNTYNNLEQLQNGLSEITAGLNNATTSLKQIEEIPLILTELSSTLHSLNKGGYFNGQFLPGITTTEESLEEMSAGVGSGLEEIRYGNNLKDAMKKQAEEYDTFLGASEEAESRVRFIFKIEKIEK